MDFKKHVILACTILSISTSRVFALSNSSDTNVQVILSCPQSHSTCRNNNTVESRAVVTLSSGIKVMCDTLTEGGGWIIFQRRINGKLSFYRGWEDYRYGFGDFTTGEFYLGNEIVHRLTSKRRYEMRVDLEYNNNKYFARYSRFRILGEAENYRLQISGYSGNATDNLIPHHNNRMFSTFDKDNDDSSGNCAQSCSGAWWYGSCQESNLNGLWGSRANGGGMNWYRLTTNTASVTYSEMKLREIDQPNK